MRQVLYVPALVCCVWLQPKGTQQARDSLSTHLLGCFMCRSQVQLDSFHSSSLHCCSSLCPSQIFPFEFSIFKPASFPRSRQRILCVSLSRFMAFLPHKDACNAVHCVLYVQPPRPIQWQHQSALSVPFCYCLQLPLKPSSSECISSS